MEGKSGLLRSNDVEGEVEEVATDGNWEDI